MTFMSFYKYVCRYIFVWLSTKYDSLKTFTTIDNQQSGREFRNSIMLVEHIVKHDEKRYEIINC